MEFSVWQLHQLLACQKTLDKEDFLLRRRFDGVVLLRLLSGRGRRCYRGIGGLWWDGRCRRDLYHHGGLSARDWGHLRSFLDFGADRFGSPNLLRILLVLELGLFRLWIPVIVEIRR